MNDTLALLILTGAAVYYPVIDASPDVVVSRWILVWTSIFILYTLIKIKNELREPSNSDS